MRHHLLPGHPPARASRRLLGWSLIAAASICFGSGCGTRSPAEIAASDESAAVQAVAEARKAMAELSWDEAGAKASHAAELAKTDATRNEAAKLQEFAPRAKTMFTRLNEPGELQRSWDTHPSLLRIAVGDSDMMVIPVVDAKARPLEVPPGDPVQFIETARLSGPVTVLIKGQHDFILATLPTDFGAVTRVDVAKAIAERRVGIIDRIAALRGGEHERDALAWYVVARDAYRDRLDDLVSEPLTQAFALDADLIEHVRNERATVLFTAMKFHMKNGNLKQADSIHKRIVAAYGDTQAGKEALEYWAHPPQR